MKTRRRFMKLVEEIKATQIAPRTQRFEDGCGCSMSVTFWGPQTDKARKKPYKSKAKAKTRSKPA